MKSGGERRPANVLGCGMTDFVVTFWSGPDSDIAMEQSASNAKAALAIAEGGGSGSSIRTPDGDEYDVTDFRHAVEGGEFDA